MRVIVAGLLIAALPSFSAQAAPVSAEDLISGFNTIVLGDLTSGPETEGTVFVGGSISGNATNVNPDGIGNFTFGNGLSGALFVGGDLNATVAVHSGDTVIGGSINGTLNNNGGGTVTQGVGVNGLSGIPVAEVADLLTGLSTQLAGLEDTGGIISLSDQNRQSFNVGIAPPAISVFNLTEDDASDLNRSGTFFGVLNDDMTLLDDGLTAIINVAGKNASLAFNPGGQLGSALGQTNVIFNFFEAETLNISGSGHFGILAPFADVTLGGGGVNGFVVAGALTQGAEIRPVNDETFTGELPPSAVPLPASLLMFLSALGLMGFLSARRIERV